MQRNSNSKEKNRYKVLLTGASGTIGSEVLSALAPREDIQLTVFDLKTRHSEKAFLPYSSKVRFIFGDIANQSDITEAAKDQDLVIHLAAIIPPMADEKPELSYRVNVKGTENLIAALEEHSPDAFLMFSSSVSVYGDRVASPEIRVGDPLRPSLGDGYARTKVAAEELIQQSDLNWTIFRLNAIMKNHKISKLMFHMPLNTTLEICTPEDTARAFVNGISKREELNKRIFNLGGGEACTTTYQSFLQRSFQLFGLGRLNFAPNSFATHNFHCGSFADGDELEEILHFRRDNLESYFERVQKEVKKEVKALATIFRFSIKKYLQSQSEPLKAVRKKDANLMERFFGKKGAALSN